MLQSKASIGAIIRYWLIPKHDRVHVHRLDVEHAFSLANATQEEIREVLLAGQAQQEAQHLNLVGTIQALDWTIARGFDGVQRDLGSLERTVEGGLYRLHLDATAQIARLDDLILLLYDRSAYERELQRRKDEAEAKAAEYRAQSLYSDAMSLTNRAMREADLDKAGAMLDEAIVLFRRAADHPRFALDAAFQHAYLAEHHLGDDQLARSLYMQALGPRFSAHFVRTSRHLAHLDGRQGCLSDALAWLEPIIAHDESITAFQSDLAAAAAHGWKGGKVVSALDAALTKHSPLLNGCTRLASIRARLADERRFTATESFLQSRAEVVNELDAMRPNLRAYLDAARYAVCAGRVRSAVAWMRHCDEAQQSQDARHAFLLEALADPELRYE